MSKSQSCHQISGLIRPGLSFEHQDPIQTSRMLCLGMETVPGGAASNKKVVRATQQFRDLLMGSMLGLRPKVHCMPMTNKRESRHSLTLICV